MRPIFPSRDFHSTDCPHKNKKYGNLDLKSKLLEKMGEQKQDGNSFFASRDAFAQKWLNRSDLPVNAFFRLPSTSPNLIIARLDVFGGQHLWHSSTPHIQKVVGLNPTLGFFLIPSFLGRHIYLKIQFFKNVIDDYLSSKFSTS